MAAPSNPLFASQWYLDSGGNVDLNILPVWDPGSGAAYTGAGVSVLIFDDAVEIDPINGYVHSDLDRNYARDDVTGGFLHLTIGGVTYAPEPIRDGTGVPDTHGTQVAGVLAAENNDEGGVGVAYDITFTVAPILHSDAQPDRVGALQRSEDFDITNHSWGYQTDFEDNFDAAGWSGFAAALETSTTVGRGGLGTINVTSAGNDRQDGSDTNFHSFENSRFTITVAAADETGSIARYSRPGANILVSGLSDDGAGNGQIVTTDLLGSDGENSQTGSDGDYSHTFGGTSAAAPQVSSIVALMLEANPNLGWRDVQDILAYTARHTGGAIGGGRRTGTNSTPGRSMVRPTGTSAACTTATTTVSGSSTPAPRCDWRRAGPCSRRRLTLSTAAPFHQVTCSRYSPCPTVAKPVTSSPTAARCAPRRRRSP